MWRLQVYSIDFSPYICSKKMTGPGIACDSFKIPKAEKSRFKATQFSPS